jgi:hypothetical protein
MCKVFLSDFDFFHFVQREFLFGAIVQLRGPERFVVCDGLGMLQRSVEQIRRDAGGSKGMAAGGVGSPASFARRLII